MPIHLTRLKSIKIIFEEQYHIIPSEWESIVKINSAEGGVEAFFDECKQTNQLFDRLLIPTVESAIAGHDQNHLPIHLRNIAQALNYIKS